MIGDRIKQLRLEKGTTQKDLSDFLGVTPKMVSFYENNKRFPSQAYISKIAKYFDVTTDYILGVSDVKTMSEADELKRLKTQLENELALLSVRKKEALKEIDAFDRSIGSTKTLLLTYQIKKEIAEKDLAEINESIDCSKQKLYETKRTLVSIVASNLPNKTDLLRKAMPEILGHLSETFEGIEINNIEDENGDIVSTKVANIIKFIEESDFEIQVKALSHLIKDIELDEEKNTITIFFREYKDGD